MTERLEPRWSGLVIVAAPGHSLTQDVADQCRGFPVVAVNDAYQLFPDADVLYAADRQWWEQRQGAPEFRGERWSCCRNVLKDKDRKKRQTAERYGIRLVEGKRAEGFSNDPACIHLGLSSGFQATNAAMLWGGSPVVLVGFNMNGEHFFGKHKHPLTDTRDYQRFIFAFRQAVSLNPDVNIINATPNSSLGCFPMMSLTEALDCASRAA